MTSSPTFSPTIPTEIPTASPVNIFAPNTTVSDVAEPVANGLVLFVLTAGLVLWLYTNIVKSFYLYTKGVELNIEKNKTTNDDTDPEKIEKVGVFWGFLRWASVISLFGIAWGMYNKSLREDKATEDLYNPRDIVAVTLSTWSLAYITLVYFGSSGFYTYFSRFTRFGDWYSWFLPIQSFGVFAAYIGFPLATGSIIFSNTQADVITDGDTTVNQGILWFSLAIAVVLAADASLSTLAGFYFFGGNFFKRLIKDFMRGNLLDFDNVVVGNVIDFKYAMTSKIFGNKSDNMVGAIPYIDVPSWLHVFSHSLFWFAAGYGIYRDTAQATVYYLVLGGLPLFFTLINGNKNFYPAYHIACVFWFYVIVYFAAGVIPDDVNINLMVLDKSSTPVTDFGSSITFVSWFSFSLAILSIFLTIRFLFVGQKTFENNSKVTF